MRRRAEGGMMIVVYKVAIGALVFAIAVGVGVLGFLVAANLGAKLREHRKVGRLAVVVAGSLPLIAGVLVWCGVFVWLVQLP
jgi:hypothetical protein